MKKTYMLEDLDCANCAAKMEKSIQQIEGINEASVNFMTQKMVLNFEEDADIDGIMKQVKKAIKKVEPDCKVK